MKILFLENKLRIDKLGADMKKFIVTTTIHSPTKATLKYCAMKDWTLIVIGDKKTPHKSYDNVNCIYLHPDEQEKLYPELSNAIGWNKVMRRNIGFVHAYKLGADIVATVDDDNIPYDDWGEDLLIGKECVCDYYMSESFIAEPLSVTNVKNIWHRGFPLELLKKRKVTYKGKKIRKVLIQADLWDGDPDIDAIARLTQNEIVKFDITKPYCFNKISPFNSQNTFLAREVIPYYAVLPYVGRMDDIWGGYILQIKFPNSLVYNKASVYQDRNVQDLIKNLEDECIGYRHTLEFVEMNANLELPFIPEIVRKFYKIYRNEFKRSMK